MSIRINSSEYHIQKVSKGYIVSEYRSIRCFRGYRDVTIKSVLIENLKNFLISRHGEDCQIIRLEA
jgi:hypothetical protein